MSYNIVHGHHHYIVMLFPPKHFIMCLIMCCRKTWSSPWKISHQIVFNYMKMLPFSSHPAFFTRNKPNTPRTINHSNTPSLPWHSLLCKPRDREGSIIYCRSETMPSWWWFTWDEPRIKVMHCIFWIGGWILCSSSHWHLKHHSVHQPVLTSVHCQASTSSYSIQ